MRRLTTIIIAALFFPCLTFGFEGRIISVGPEIIKVEVDGQLGLFDGDLVRMLNRGFLDAYTGRFVVHSVSPGLVELAPISIEGILEKGMRVALTVINKGDDAVTIPAESTVQDQTPGQSSGESFTGKVIKVDKDSVTITVFESGKVMEGSRVDLYFKMSSGRQMEVGQWKVIKSGQGTIDAAPVDMIGRPMVGLTAKISPAEKRKENIKTSVATINGTQSYVIEKSADEHVIAGNRYLKENKDKMAFIEFKQASEKGHAGAQNFLGHMYFNGKGVKQDYKQSREWYEKSAQQNNASSIYNLGVIYSQGRGVNTDMKKAYDLFFRSANLGDSHAQYNLGVMYKKGMVVEKDLFKSFNWFDMAARQNLPEALFMVGNEYEYGNGVTKNTATAMMYYKKAAGLGEKKAIKRLNTP